MGGDTSYRSGTLFTVTNFHVTLFPESGDYSNRDDISRDTFYGETLFPATSVHLTSVSRTIMEKSHANVFPQEPNCKTEDNGSFFFLKITFWDWEINLFLPFNIKVQGSARLHWKFNLDGGDLIHPKHSSVHWQEKFMWVYQHRNNGMSNEGSDCKIKEEKRRR